MAFRDLASRSNYYYQMDAQKDAEKRTSNPKPRNQQHQSEHEIYCYQMGIFFPHGSNHPYAVRNRSYLYERKKEYQRHSQQYWLVATATTAFFILQIIIGAIQTALGALKRANILVTVFGAIATVIGGVLAYLKSRGQPNRARQLRNSLRKVVEEIEFQEIQFRNPATKTTAKEAVDYINQLYEDARFQAETNYPDFWSTAGTKQKARPGSGANSPAATADPKSASSQPTQTPSNPQRSSTEARPPSHDPPQQQTSTQSTASSGNYTGPTPPNPAAHISSQGGTSLQAPVPAAHIPSEGGKPLQSPHRGAHISTRGGRYMNEVV